MGIILKRRDNAPIAKHFYAGVIDTFLRRIHDPEIQQWITDNPGQDVKTRLIEEALRFLDTETKKLLSDKFRKDRFVVSKTLKSSYKKPESIAHKMLAERANERGTDSFQSNDRVPYVHIVVPSKKGEKLLQGDRIETPDFAAANKLRIDYKHYLERQIETPVAQVFALVLEQLDGYQKRRAEYDKMLRDTDKLQDTRTRIAADILFKGFYLEYERKLSGNKSMNDFFKTVPKKSKDKVAEDDEGPSSSGARVAPAKIAKTPPKNNAMENFIGKGRGHTSWTRL